MRGRIASTLRQYHAKADRRLDRLPGVRAAHPAGRILQDQARAWRTKFFVFLADRRVPATNNISEREVRPSVIFRKSLPCTRYGVSGGFRSKWGAAVHAGYRSIVSTARLYAQTALQAIADLIDGNPLATMWLDKPAT